MEPNAQNPQPQNTNETPESKSPVPGTSITPETPVAPEAPAAEPIPVTPPPALKSPSNKKPLLIVLLIVLLLIAAGAVYWFVLKGDDTKSTSTSQGNQDSNVVADGEFDPAVKFAEYAADIKQTYPDMSDFKANNSDSELGNFGPAVYSEKIAQYVWLQSPAEWSGMFGRSSSATPDYTTDFTAAPFDSLVGKLKADGFSDYAPGNAPKHANSGVTLVNEDIICSVERSSTQRIAYSCARLSTLAASADFVKPFYDAYLQKFPDAYSGGCQLLVRVEESDVAEAEDFPEFETASGSSSCVGTIGGGAAHFYRIKGGAWNYSHGGQDAPMCSEFEDADQQKAFVETGCYADDGFAQTTVGEYHSL